jgi:hypothetical protein
MSVYHKDTIIYGNGWFSSTNKIENIPDPCCIVVDTFNTFSDHLPTIFIQVEPQCIVDSESYLINNSHKYHTIYTFNKNILDKCNNAKRYIYGTKWLSPNYYDNITISKKQFKISSLTGSKLVSSAVGHKVRQTFYHHQHLFQEFPITWYRSYHQQPHIHDYGKNPFISDKIELFDEYQFAIVIENSKQIYYFTEKIIDCVLSKTIPIYWGCPNISDYFDITGWIILETETIEELQIKLRTLTPDYYNKYMDIIEKNHLKAKEYIDLYKNLNNAI